MMSGPTQKSIAKTTVLLLVFCCHLNSSFGDPIKNDGTKVYFQYNSPLHPTVYRVVKGSLTGIQQAFDDHNHDSIAKDEEFTVLVNFSSPLYNQERQWYEIPARFCYGKDIEGCVNQTRPFSNPYLVRPSSAETPVPFLVPFSKLYNATSPDGKTVFVAGTVHEQFKTFEVNGTKYDKLSGILVNFSAESPPMAGKISAIEFSRDKGRILKHQPLIQCHFVEWNADGCVPGLDNVMLGYDTKFMKLKSRRWLKAVNFPNRSDYRYLQTLEIPGIGRKNYLVFKDMILEKVFPIANPFTYLFTSVEEHVNTALESVGLGPRLRYGQPQLLGSGKYESFSKYYQEQSYSGAMSGTEFRFFRATMSNFYLEDEANWDDGFKTKWKSMFMDQSNKRNAMDFFKEYGTHYVVQAVMGGRQESVFTVDYCEVTKKVSTKVAFETELKNPYKFYSRSVSIQAYYRYMKSSSLVKIIISGPKTTCTGGNSLDTAVCYDLSLWRSSVLANPYPIRMTLKPFYDLVKGYDRLWLKNMYEEYLKADLDYWKLNRDIKLKVKCQGRTQFDGGSGRSYSTGGIAGGTGGSVGFIFFAAVVYRYYRKWCHGE